MENDRYVLFREVQRFRQLWLWLAMGVISVVPLGLYGYGIFQQLVRGVPFGDMPTSNAVLLITGLLCMVGCGGVLVLFMTMKLITEVRSDGLYVRFYPLHFRFRKIERQEIAEYRAVKYHPVQDYGGWGIRWTFRGRAYNVRGNEGVRLDYVGGRHLLIGSQESEKFVAALQTIWPD